MKTKAKIYIPVIVGIGAIAGAIIGVTTTAPNRKDHEHIAQETTIAVTGETTTLSEEEKKAKEEEKKREFEEKKKKEEENMKKKEDEKEKEKAEKKEEKESDKEDKEKDKEKETKETKKKDDSSEAKESEDEEQDDYDYIYQDEDTNSSGNGGNAYTPVSTPVQYTPQTAPASTSSVHRHNWQAVYKTVHHDAQTHTENKKVGSVEKSDCSTNGEISFTLITESTEGGFYQVCKLANGDYIFETDKQDERKDVAYFMSQLGLSEDDDSVSVSSSTDDITDEVTVTDKDAYDEKVFDYYVCTGCGQRSY